MRSESALQLFNPDALSHLEKLAGTLAKSTLIPDALKGKPGDILVTLMTGAELGLQPMQALRSIAVVKGKPTLSADLMVSLVKQRKDVCEYLTLVKSSPEEAVYEAKRVGEPKPTTITFTMQDAARAGLANSDTYRKYPAQMLRARCASGICRAVFPDLCMGLYDSDSGELTDGRVEREVNEAPASRVEQVREDMKAKGLIIDQAPGETEAAAVARHSEPLLLVPGEKKGQPLTALTFDELSGAMDWAHMQLEEKPNAKSAPKLREHLRELEAEVGRRERAELPLEVGAEG